MKCGTNVACGISGARMRRRFIPDYPENNKFLRQTGGRAVIMKRLETCAWLTRGARGGRGWEGGGLVAFLRFCLELTSSASFDGGMNAKSAIRMTLCHESTLVVGTSRATVGRMPPSAEASNAAQKSRRWSMVEGQITCA